MALAIVADVRPISTYTYIERKPAPSRGAFLLPFEATAYAPTGNLTYTGTVPKEGRTLAVDPTVIPLHSKVRLSCPSYPSVNGVYVAEDVGGVIKGRKIDVFMLDGCVEFGRRMVYVEVME